MRRLPVSVKLEMLSLDQTKSTKLGTFDIVIAHVRMCMLFVDITWEL